MNNNFDLDDKLHFLRKIWKTRRRGEGRFGEMVERQYLKEAYTLFNDLESLNMTCVATQELARDLKRKSHRDRHPLRILFDATCNADGNTKQRWVSAAIYNDADELDCIKTIRRVSPIRRSLRRRYKFARLS